MYLRVHLIFSITFFILLAALLPFSITHAASTLWNKTETAQLCADAQMIPCATKLFDPSISITYLAQVRNDNTGEVYACDAGNPIHVSAGTPLTLEFLPHEYTHVYWFGTGSSMDSPYGEWRQAAAFAPIPGSALPFFGGFGSLNLDPRFYSFVNGAGPFCQQKDFYSAEAPTPHIPLGSVGPRAYATLVVSPPDKKISGADTLGCTAAENSDLSCTTPSASASIVTFHFAPTFGKFYGQYAINNVCGVDLRPMRHFTSFFNNNSRQGSEYTLSVPEQTISCPIIVDSTPEQETEGAPTTPALSSIGQCTVGTPHAITMTATDPDNDQIRYGVDWDADGSVDEFVPPSGSIPSGTPQTASRTYSIAGTKTVKVLAQDVNGLSSPWASMTFSCADTPVTAQCSDNTDNDGDGLIDLNDPDCTNGSDTSEFSRLPSVPPPPPSIPTADLRLSLPSLVGRGKTVQVVWSADNVTSCLPVSGTNGDSFAQLSSGNSFFSPIGGKTSSPITTRTSYTLSCVDLNGITRIKTASVNIQPNFRER